MLMLNDDDLSAQTQALVKTMGHLNTPLVKALLSLAFYRNGDLIAGYLDELTPQQLAFVLGTELIVRDHGWFRLNVRISDTGKVCWQKQ